MSDGPLIPAGTARQEIKVVDSRFIASAGPAFSAEAARQFIAGIRSEYSDAAHNVAAFVVGHAPNTMEHANDDGEPPGTAGRPALAVLRGSGLGDIVVVVSRYFGGTKLGRGGLVRAYADAVREVLRILPRARKIATSDLRIEVPYSDYDHIRRLIGEFGGKLLQEEFATEVQVSLRLASSQLEAFQELLSEKTQGRIQAEVVDSSPGTIIPC